MQMHLHLQEVNICPHHHANDITSLVMFNMTVLRVETHYRCDQLSDLMLSIFPVIRISVLFSSGCRSNKLITLIFQKTQKLKLVDYKCSILATKIQQRGRKWNQNTSISKLQLSTVLEVIVLSYIPSMVIQHLTRFSFSQLMYIGSEQSCILLFLLLIRLTITLRVTTIHRLVGKKKSI